MDELKFVRDDCVFVIDDANDELLFTTFEEMVSTLPAIDEENVVFTDPTLVMEAASDELLF